MDTEPPVSTNTTVPDEVFDADLLGRTGKHGDLDRFDWVVVDGLLTHSPAVGWAWTCSECGESGTMPDDLLVLPHGAQHAAGAFDPMPPLLIEAVRGESDPESDRAEEPA